jgi:hypothetical protein
MYRGYPFSVFTAFYIKMVVVKAGLTEKLVFLYSACLRDERNNTSSKR